MNFYNILFFYKDRLVLCINNIELDIDDKDIEHIIKLYIYSKNNNLNNYLIVSEFLFTYFNSIGSNGYKQSFDGDYNQKKHKLRELFKKYNISYISIKKETLDYYELIFDDLTKEDDNFSYYYLDRACNNFKSDKKMLSHFIKKYLDKGLHLSRVLKYDFEADIHKDKYINYLNEIFDDYSFSRYPQEYVLEMNKRGLLNEDNINSIINKIINRVNRFIDYSTTLEIHFIELLSLIDDTNSFVNTIIQNIEGLNDNQKEKLSECNRSLLFIKRKIIANEDYSSTNLREIGEEQPIKKEEIKKVVISVTDNPYTIYAHLKHDFFKDMENSLELYAKYPIGSIVSVFSIDSEKQTYNKPNDILYNNPFKVLFDKYGKDYTKKHPKLLNKLNCNYYEEMIKRISYTSKMKATLLYMFLKDNNRYDDVVYFLTKHLHTFNKNKYVMVAKNIIYVEGLITEILKKKNLPVSNEGYKNVYALLSFSNDNRDIINGLMYINYVLYEKYGLNLRNNIAHGSLINNKLEIELLIVLSCNIFVQWLYDKIIGDENEKTN